MRPVLRLNVLPIAMPPLRTQIEDVFFGGVPHRPFQHRVPEERARRQPAAYTVLQQYAWPGNVRRLRNVIERAMLLSDGTRLDARDFAALRERPRLGCIRACRRTGSISDSWNAAWSVRRCAAAGNQTRAAGLSDSTAIRSVTA